MGISQECCLCTTANNEREYDGTHRTACAAIFRRVLLKTISQFRRQLHLCIQENGGNFEQLIRD